MPPLLAIVRDRPIAEFDCLALAERDFECQGVGKGWPPTRINLGLEGLIAGFSAPLPTDLSGMIVVDQAADS